MSVALSTGVLPAAVLAVMGGRAILFFSLFGQDVSFFERVIIGPRNWADFFASCSCHLRKVALLR